MVSSILPRHTFDSNSIITAGVSCYVIVFQDGDLQLWSLSDGRLLESMPFADPVTSVAIMHDEPFILLGCASGNVQVVGMLDSSGNSAAAAAPVHTLELQPFQGALFGQL